MKGTEVRDWRIRIGYLNQTDLMWELGIKSRTTLSNIETSPDEVPRMIGLALLALERVPETRQIFGKRDKLPIRGRL